MSGVCQPVKGNETALTGCLIGAMGEVGDPSAVIDSKARVMGVRGLRVVDASAFPFLPPGHPSAVVCESISNRMYRLVNLPSLHICND